VFPQYSEGGTWHVNSVNLWDQAGNRRALYESALRSLGFPTEIEVVVNQPPVANAGGPYEAGEGHTITLDASSSSDPDENIVLYEWDLDNDGEYDDATGIAPEVVFEDDDTFTVGLRVTDEFGKSDTDTAEVMVFNVAPTATFNAPVEVDEGSAINLSLTDPLDPSADDTAAGFEYAFDCGDSAGYAAFSTNHSATCPTNDNGTRTIKGKIKDKDGGVTEYTASVTVNNVAPTATFNAPANVDEGSGINLSLTAPFDPSSADTDASFEYAFDCGDGAGYAAFSTSNSTTCPTNDNGIRTVKGQIQDKDGGVTEYTASVTVNNMAPTIDTITAPVDPVNINDQPVSVEVAFSDPSTADTHDVTWDWGDTTGDRQYDANSPASQGHTYAEASVYAVQVTVTDDDGGSATQTYEYIVIYNPDGGFVTGGGWIMSPAEACNFGACTENTTGKANFGFVSKYKKGANVPTGETEFQFKAGNLNFHSDSYEWLVVTGSDYARFKGVGTINGEGAYKFMLWAGDSDPDTFRIRIWTEDEATAVETDVYDNDFDQAIGGGSIVIHTSKK